MKPRFARSHDLQEALEALAEISLLASSGLPLREVLREGLRVVAELVDAEGAGVLLFNASRKELALMEPAFGFEDPELIRRYCVPVEGPSNAARVFRTGRPYITNRALGDPKVLQEFVRLYRARSILSLPLEVGSDRIGVLHVINKREGEFGLRDLRLLEIATPFLAALIRASQLHQALEAKRRAAEKVLALSEQFVRLLLEHKEEAYPALLEELTQVLGKEVGFVSPHGELLWPPNPSSGLAEAGSRVAAMGLSSLGQAKIQGISWVPVMTPKGLRGWILMRSGEAPAELSVEQALRHTALALALALAYAEERLEIELRLKGNLLTDLLTGRLSKITEEQALATMGLGARLAYRVALLEWQGSGTVDLSKARACFLQEGLGWVGAFVGRVLILVSAPGVEADLEARARGLGTFRGGLGRPYPGAEGLRRSYAEAADCLRVLQRLGCWNRLLRREDLNLEPLFLRAADPGVLRETASKVMRTLEGKAELIATLEVLLEVGPSPKRLARRLGIHPNTAKQRLARIQRLTGLDPHRPLEMVHLSLAWLAFRLLGGLDQDSNSLPPPNAEASHPVM